MNPIIPVIIVLAILIFLNNIPKVGYLLSNVFLGVLFLFAIPNIDEKLGSYYSIMLLFIFIFSFIKLTSAPKDTSEAEVSGFKFKDITFSLAALVIGVLIYFAMRSLQGSTEQSILGVPELLAVAGVTGYLMPSLIGALGFIENRFFFGLFAIIFTFLIPNPIIAGIIASVLFGLFHVAAFGLAVGSIIFAILIMFIWILFFLTPFGEEPTSTSHYLWNSDIATGKVLSIAKEGLS